MSQKRAHPKAENAVIGAATQGVHVKHHSEPLWMQLHWDAARSIWLIDYILQGDTYDLTLEQATKKFPKWKM